MIRIGNGQGFWGDWLEAPVRLVEDGPLDYLILDYLAEVTMSILQKQKAANPEQHDMHHGNAFRDLDGSIHDLYCMAEIAAEVATGTQTDERLEMTHFALYQLRDIIVDLRTKYRSDLAAGKAAA